MSKTTVRKKPAALAATKTLTTCAALVALTVVISRLFGIMPSQSARFSIEAVPIFLAGMLCGPFAGALVGFSADAIGTLFTPYGFNPLFCLPPILYGVCGGLFRAKLREKPSIWRIALAFAPAVVFGSILWQSATLAWVYGGDAFRPFFTTKLVERSIQFGVTYVLDVTIVYLLQKSKVLESAKLYTPTERKERL